MLHDSSGIFNDAVSLRESPVASLPAPEVLYPGEMQFLDCKGLPTKVEGRRSASFQQRCRGTVRSSASSMRLMDCPLAVRFPCPANRLNSAVAYWTAVSLIDTSLRAHFQVEKSL